MAKVEWYATTKLKEKRESMGFTQKDMADFIYLNTGQRISDSLYQKWELGQQHIPADRVKQLTKMLSVGVDDLVVRK